MPMARAAATLVLAIVAALGTTTVARAQDDVDYRFEAGAALGTSNYRGQLNHKLLGQMGVAGGAMARWVINPYMAMKGMLDYASLKGSTGNVGEYFPPDAHSPEATTTKRSYSFSGGVVDFSATYEYNFWPYGLHHGYQGRQRITTFLQLGIGTCYSTEGKALALQLPIGVGVKYKLRPRVNLGFDWLYHFSLTDKLDGFSSPHGVKSSGFHNKDSYCTAVVYITYDFSPKCPQCNKN